MNKVFCMLLAVAALTTDRAASAANIDNEGVEKASTECHG